MMGGGLIVGGAVVAVVFVISLDRRVRNAFQGVSVAFQNVCTSKLYIDVLPPTWRGVD